MILIEFELKRVDVGPEGSVYFAKFSWLRSCETLYGDFSECPLYSLWVRRLSGEECSELSGSISYDK